MFKVWLHQIKIGIVVSEHHHHYHHLKRHVNVCYRVTGILEYLPQAALPPLAMLAHWLCYFNSSINPVIYNFMSCTYVLQSPFTPPPLCTASWGFHVHISSSHHRSPWHFLCYYCDVVVIGNDVKKDLKVWAFFW